jgi:hypothetical protein
MTKVEAIKKVLEDNGGVAIWNIIYNQLENYYPKIKAPKDWKAGVRGVLYRDLGKSFKMLDEGLIALIDYDENNLVLEEDVQDTSKTIETKVRMGQALFRKNLLKKISVCPISGISDKRLLMASHIKPWAVSNNRERLDINNGFIFSPNIDKLFDKGLISFENSAKLIISPTLLEYNISKLGIERDKIYPKLPVLDRLSYLEYHRENIFIYE